MSSREEVKGKGASQRPCDQTCPDLWQSLRSLDPVCGHHSTPEARGLMEHDVGPCLSHHRDLPGGACKACHTGGVTLVLHWVRHTGGATLSASHKWCYTVCVTPVVLHSVTVVLHRWCHTGCVGNVLHWRRYTAFVCITLGASHWMLSARSVADESARRIASGCESSWSVPPTRANRETTHAGIAITFDAIEIQTGRIHS